MLWLKCVSDLFPVPFVTVRDILVWNVVCQYLRNIGITCITLITTC